METRSFTYLEKSFKATELPNGMRVVSGESFKNGNGKRIYEVCIAGGRLADVDPPGAGLAFVNVLPRLLKEATSKDLPHDAVQCSWEHGYVRMLYNHHGRDDSDVHCLHHLLSSIMTHSPSAKACRETRNDKHQTKHDTVNGFWTWFYSKVSPSWQRMCIPHWTEALFAEQVDRGSTLRYRDRIVHPANMLVCSSEPELHDDLVYGLVTLNPNKMDSERYVCKAPTVALVHEEYPYANPTRKTVDLLFYFPLSADRFMFLKLAILFYAIFGEGGYFADFLKKEKLRLKLETCLTFWPQPFAFVKVTVKPQNIEHVKGMIGLATLGFCSLRREDMVKYLHAAEQDTEATAANPLALIRDEWLANKDSKMGKEHISFAFSALKYLFAANLSESRMGVIYGLPSLPKGVSLFSSL